MKPSLQSEAIMIKATTLLIFVIAYSTLKTSASLVLNKRQVEQQHRPQQTFCVKHKCECKSEDEIKCKFNSTTKHIEFMDPGVTNVDFSGNSLETFVFGDTPLSVHILKLSSNKIKEINENMFDKMPHLHSLDLSNNQIGKIEPITFTNLNKVEYLNMSSAFDSKFHISKEICKFVSLKILDLSYANLEELSFECAERPNGSINLEELYMMHAINAEKSWPHWFPWLGSNLKRIDLSDSAIKTVDSSFGNKFPSLISLTLANNPDLDKISLFTILHKTELGRRLEILNLKNIKASKSNLDLKVVFSDTNDTMSLRKLDISENSYDDDLNAFLFNQKKLEKLVEFHAAKNRFAFCTQQLYASSDTTLLKKLEFIDLSGNSLDDHSCLLSMMPINTLKHIDLSKNKIAIPSNKIREHNLYRVFSDMTSLMYLDLSSNKLSTLALYLAPNRSRIDKFDLSNNNLIEFRFISMTNANDVHAPFNLNEEKRKKPNSKPKKSNNQVRNDKTEDYDSDEDSQDDDDSKEDEGDGDDDERMTIIDSLDLSKNKLKLIDLQHMLQSVGNVLSLNLSLNPIDTVINLSTRPLLELIVKNASVKQKNTPAEVDDPLREILCIDKLDLSRCQIKTMPSLQHVCINQIDLSSNRIHGNVFLHLSSFSLYFLDYVNLQSNNITRLKLITNQRHYKQDEYKIQNSPFEFALRNQADLIKNQANNTVHTCVDIRMNKDFKCDCELYKNLNDIQKIKLISDCFRNASEYDLKCKKFDRLSINTLNEKFRTLFVITCLLLASLFVLTLYYICSDLFRNVNPFDRVRNGWQRVSSIVNCKNKLSQSVTSNKREASKGSSVSYMKLNNENMTSSNVNLLIHS
jgi:hypothetical protein